MTLLSVAGSIGLYLLLPVGCPEPARRMAAIFLIAAFFWASEAIPPHATSFLVVLMEILFLTVRGSALGITGVDYRLFLNPLSQPVIFLFLGGVVMAAVLCKHGLDKELVERFLRIFGKNSFTLMMGFMMTTAFFSFWMSGTATAAMMLILIRPLLPQIDESDPFRKALVLSIPFGARIGGLCTPVGTPPNAIAVGILEEKGIHLGFLSWMTMGIPLALIMLVITGLVLYGLFKPHRREVSLNLPSDTPVSANGRLVLAIAIVTIFLWLTSGLHKVPEAVIAIGACASFFGWRLLDRSAS
jgi:sodium-dependent dicarboxylate transporter 2/3/5